VKKQIVMLANGAMMVFVESILMSVEWDVLKAITAMRRQITVNGLSVKHIKTVGPMNVAKR